MKDSLAVTISAFALVLVAVASQTAAYPAPDGHPGAVLPHKAVGELAIPEDRLLQHLLLRAYLQKNNMGPAPNAPRAKKTCLLNAGLSHSCDYRDAVAAIEEGYYLGSMDTPGRK